MKSSLWLTAASIVLVSSMALAQTQSQTQPRETMPDNKDSHSDGTAPHGMGSTGWTGGTGGSHIGTSNELSAPGGQTVGLGHTGAEAPLGLETATGVDLNGPPTRFPTNETPE